MAGGHVRVVRMHHQRNSHRFKAAACQLRAVCSGRGGHGVAVYVRKIHASLLEHAAIAQHAAAPAATGFALPLILLKFTAIDGAQFLANGILQLEQEGFDQLCVGFH